VTTYTPDPATIIDELKNNISTIYDATGAPGGLIITMAIPVKTVLELADKITRWLDVANFSQGGLEFRVRSP